MAAILKLYKATISTDEEYYFLQSPGSYGGDIDTATGITVATETEQDRPSIAVNQLVRKAKLFRITVSYTEGTRRRTGKLLCTKTKLATIFDDLNQKAFRGGVIQSVRISQKAAFY